METAPEPHRYPQGTGWMAGFILGAIVGVTAWLLASEVSIGLILFAATGTALGFAFEQAMATRPPTRRERRLALILLVFGILVGLLVGIYAILAD